MIDTVFALELHHLVGWAARSRFIGVGNMPRWADAFIGGWKTNGIWRISDGRPLTFQVADGLAVITGIRRSDTTTAKGPLRSKAFNPCSGPPATSIRNPLPSARFRLEFDFNPTNCNPGRPFRNAM